MNIYVVYYYLADRFDGIYGVYKSDKEAQVASKDLEDAGFRPAIQMFPVKQFSK